MKAIKLKTQLYEYFLAVGFREQPLLQKIRIYAEQQPRAQLLSTADTAQLLQMLVRLMRPQQILEIGTFLGYSAAAMALALPEKGKITTCEIFDDYADMAENFWREGNLKHKITCLRGLALENLQLLAESSFDLIFIDADKASYDAYYERSLALAKQGGIIVLDNMLFHGRVIDENEQSSGTLAIRQLNDKIKQDNRVDMLMLTVGDGVTVVVKR